MPPGPGQSPISSYRERYGPMNSDRPNFPFASVTGSSSLADAGWPNATSAQNGVIWYRNDWTVVTVHANGQANRVRFWGSRYGQPPKLLGDTAAWNLGALNMGRGTSGYTGLQLTPFITGNTNAAGAAQPTVWCEYGEIIGSTNPINHPGGFALPGV